MRLQYTNQGADPNRHAVGMARPWYDIARARARLLGLTYQDIADRMGVCKATVGHWLTGRNQPRIETIKGIAAVLSMPVSELIGEDAYFLTEDDERTLVDAYRALTPAQRAQAAAVLRALNTPPAPLAPPKPPHN
jgi:transcriptional regulator with XRE-family HTH domain